MRKDFSKQGLYTIYDKGTGEYSPIHHAPNDVVAERHFTHFLVKVSKFDRLEYVLYNVGVFDLNTGEVKGHKPKEVKYAVPDSEIDARQEEMDFIYNQGVENE